MNESIELLEVIYKTSAMGRFSTGKLLDDLKEKDNKIKGYLEEILKEYQSYEEKSKELLLETHIEPMEENAITKMMAATEMKKEVKVDNSDPAVAEMLIQGLTMGTLEMEKQIKQYQDRASKEGMKLAKSFLKFQEKTIEKLKKYL